MNHLKIWIAVLLNFLAGANLSHGFCNLSNGRWLSRDPVEESKDVNLYAFVRNDALAAYDKLGLETEFIHTDTVGTFTWTTDQIYRPEHEGHPGRAWLAKWDVRTWIISPPVIHKPAGSISCCWKLGASGDGRAEFYSINDAPDPRFAHEVEHCHRYHLAWNEMVGMITGVMGKCMSQKQAQCYANAASALSESFRVKGGLESLRLDVTDPANYRRAAEDWVKAHEGVIDAALAAAKVVFEDCGRQ